MNIPPLCFVRFARPAPIIQRGIFWYSVYRHLRLLVSPALLGDLECFIKIKDTTFYLPCSPGKRFSDGSYHYKSNPRHFIHIYHAENFFYPLFGINWLNQLKMDSFDDPDIENTMKHLIRDLVSILENYKWDMTDLPKWFSSYLIDCGYQEDTIHNCYIKASGSESKPATLYKDYFKSHSELFNLLSFVYGDSYLSYDIFLKKF